MVVVKRTPHELSLEARVGGERSRGERERRQTKSAGSERSNGSRSSSQAEHSDGGAPEVYEFRAADGVLSKESFRDAELLLLEHLWDAAGTRSSEPSVADEQSSSSPRSASPRENADLGRVLCPEANYGVVGTILSAAAGVIEMTESSARAAQLCRLNADENGSDARVSLLADPGDVEGGFDTVAYAPKPYTPLSVGKQRIAGALDALRPGGAFCLAAATRTGLARYEDCLGELAGDAERVRERDGWHVVRATRPASFERPEYVTTRWVHPTVDGVDLSLATVPGVFAADGLDHGTRLLLETADVADGDRVLDACCGYGAVGAYAAKHADCEVWLTDDDCVATDCAERGFEEMGLEGTIVTGDCVEAVADETFDRVLSNPPTHAGSGVLSELFEDIHGVLAPGGHVTLVHHRDLDLAPHLERFDAVSTIATGEEHVVKRAHR